MVFIVIIFFIGFFACCFHGGETKLSKLNKCLKEANTDELEVLKGIIDKELSNRP